MKSNFQRKSVWLVVPAYNEAAYIERVLKKLKVNWPQVVVVDDGSHDATVELARKHCEHVLVHKVNLGKGAALKTGCEFAFQKLGATGVIFFDADDQHDHSLIAEFAKGLENFDAVLGVRSFDNQMPILKIMMNRLASVLILLLFGKYVPDIPCGFKALSRKAYNQIDWKSRDYAVEMEIAARIAQYDITFEVVPIPTVYHDLDRGMTILDTIHIIPQAISWRFFS